MVEDLVIGDGDLRKRLDLTSKDETCSLAWFNQFEQMTKKQASQVKAVVKPNSNTGNGCSILLHHNNHAGHKKETLDKIT